VQDVSRGVLIFAFNTEAVDYVAIAEQTARLVKHTLGLPVTIITDQEVDNTFTNVRAGYAGGTAWRNGDRYTAYDVSPYDETILIDSDYLVLDRSLLTLLDTTEDYRLQHNGVGNMGVLSLDYVWATAIVFKRTEKTRLLFNLVGRIQRNYSYYCKLYQLRERNFRNDYAFAIANNIINGYTPNQSQGIPWPMLTIDKPVKQIEVNGDMLVVREDMAKFIPRQNLHIIDKDYLQSDLHVKFVDQICTQE